MGEGEKGKGEGTGREGGGCKRAKEGERRS